MPHVYLFPCTKPPLFLDLPTHHRATTSSPISSLFFLPLPSLLYPPPNPLLPLSLYPPPPPPLPFTKQTPVTAHAHTHREKMGNSLGGRRRAKVMMIDGSTIKVKAPAAAKDILRNHPGHVLLESEQVKQLGLRAKPLNPDQPLKPKKLYFLIELPKIPSPAIDHRSPQLGARRIRSGINMSAKDRLESLMLSRRTVSDITFSRAPPDSTGEGEGAGDGTLRVRLRLPKSQVARLVEESRDPAEAAEKIMDLCVGRSGDGAATRGAAAAGHVGTGAAAAVAGREAPAPGRAVNGATPVKEKRMRFALTEDEIIN